MTRKKATKTANIYANIYEGEFMLNLDCVGVEMCKYALCSLMPPDGTEECFYRKDGECTNHPSRCAAIEKLRNRLTKELKDTLQGEIS